MAYKIFISYAAQEVELANKLHSLLNNAFKGNVTFFVVTNNVVAGDKWKDKIQEALAECDSILTILTPAYILKPWAYIEWSAFWLKNKKTFIVTTEDLTTKDIVDPMSDSQVVNLFSEDSIKKLIEAIAEEIKSEYIPYEFANAIALQSKAIYGKIIENRERESYLFYKSDISMLPNDDFEKRKIFLYFYNNDPDRQLLKKIFEKINDNSVKMNLLLSLLEKNELDIIEDNFSHVENKISLKPLFKELNERGYSMSPLSEKILNHVAQSQTALRSFGEYLISNGNIRDRIFSDVISLFNSMSEFRKLCEYIIDNSLQEEKSFLAMLDQFYGRNHSELSKLLRYWIRLENCDNEVMEKHILKLSTHNKSETMKVLEELVSKDKQQVKKLISEHKDIVKKENLKRLIELTQ